MQEQVKILFFLQKLFCCKNKSEVIKCQILLLTVSLGGGVPELSTGETNDRNIILDLPISNIETYDNGKVYTLNATSVNLEENFNGDFSGWIFRCIGKNETNINEEAQTVDQISVLDNEIETKYDYLISLFGQSYLCNSRSTEIILQIFNSSNTPMSLEEICETFRFEVVEDYTGGVYTPTSTTFMNIDSNFVKISFPAIESSIECSFTLKIILKSTNTEVYKLDHARRNRASWPEFGFKNKEFYTNREFTKEEFLSIIDLRNPLEYIETPSVPLVDIVTVNIDHNYYSGNDLLEQSTKPGKHELSITFIPLDNQMYGMIQHYYEYYIIEEPTEEIPPENPEIPEGLSPLPPITPDWNNNKDGIKFLIRTARGDLAIDEVRTTSGLVMKDADFEGEKIYILMLIKDVVETTPSPLYQAICLNEAPFNIGDNIIGIQGGGTGSGEFPTKDGAQVAFVQLPINSFNPNKFYPYSCTFFIAKEYPMYDQPINLTQEDLDNLVFPTDNPHWLVKQIMWLSNQVGPNSRTFYRFAQYWYSKDHSACFKRSYAGYPTTDGSDLNWGKFEKVYDKVNQPFVTNGLITTSSQVDNINLAPGIYECFIPEGYSLPANVISVDTINHFTLIVNRHTTNNLGSNESGIGWGQQILIPFQNGIYRGLFYRLAGATSYNNPWVPIDYKEPINSITRLNAVNLPTGVYECNIGGYTGINGGVNQHFMLVNVRYSAGDMRAQLAIPYSNGSKLGVFYRLIATNNTASYNWVPVGTEAINSRINRTDNVTSPNTSYGTVMARGISMSTSAPSTVTNGAICLVYS